MYSCLVLFLYILPISCMALRLSGLPEILWSQMWYTERLLKSESYQSDINVILKKKKEHKILLYIAVHRCRWLSVSVHPRSAYFGTTTSPSKNRAISFYIQFILLNLFFSIPKKVIYWSVLATSFSENYSEGKWRLLCLAFHKLCR